MKENKSIITWYLNTVKLDKNITLDVGYCQFGSGIAFININNPNSNVTMESLSPLIIHDVYISHRECEEGKRCFNLKCPLNEAQILHFKKYGITNRKMLRNIHSFLKNVNAKLDLKTLEFGIISKFEKPPLARVKKK